MATQEQGANQTAVKTYVPAAQRESWDEHADELDMSRSEFVRTMVQAGRRGFTPRGSTPETGEIGNSVDEEGEHQDSVVDQGETDSFDDLVLDLLDEEGCLSWNELFEALTDDVETRLNDALDRLQDENEIKHSGREGGYVRHG